MAKNNQKESNIKKLWDWLVNNITIFKTDNLVLLKNKNIYGSVVRFSRINAFYISMEMLLTAYIIEMFALLTNTCSADSKPITITPFIIFFPLIVAVLATLLCLIGAIWHFQSRAVEYADRYVDEYRKKGFRQGPPDKKDKYMTFAEFVSMHRQNAALAHVLCVGLYVGISWLVATLLKENSILFNDKLVPCAVAIAFVLGILWNVDAYYRHQRILWCKIFPDLTEDEKALDVKNNCHNYRMSIIIIGLSMVVLMVLVSYVLLNFHSKDSRIKELLENNYGTLVLPFFSLVILYVKLVYSFTFKKKEGAILCPCLEDVIIEHPDYKPDGQLKGTKNPADQGAGQPEQGQEE